ncbi:MAG: MFS transporter [Azospirillaceae bacterium]|nr:MFS transporter [Azospirillaceae bacterium]
MMNNVADGLPVPQRYGAVLAIAIGIIMAVLDSAIANVALPTIARHFAADAATSIWVVNAYQLAITVSLLPFASLGAIVGYRRVYCAGLAAFTLASLGCALSTSLLALTLARIVQGFAAAGMMSVNTALIRFIYPRHLLGRGVGYNALFVATAAAAGPTVAAGVLSVASWPWLFAINVPIGVIALITATRTLPETPRAHFPFDAVSAVLSALTFGLLITGIDGLGHDERLALVGVEFAAALAVATLLVRRELTRTEPMLPIDLLRLPVFALSIITSVCSFAAQSLAFVSLPFYLQDVLGRSQVDTGLLMTPWPLSVAVMAPFAGRLADRYSSGILCGIGLIMLAAGLGSLAILPIDAAAGDIAWRMVLCGLGFGLFQSPNNRTLLSSASPERSGGASGMLATARLLGQTTGAALVALAFGLSVRHGISVALTMGAVFALIAGVTSTLRLLR